MTKQTQAAYDGDVATYRQTVLTASCSRMRNAARLSSTCWNAVSTVCRYVRDVGVVGGLRLLRHRAPRAAIEQRLCKCGSDGPEAVRYGEPVGYAVGTETPRWPTA